MPPWNLYKTKENRKNRRKVNVRKERNRSKYEWKEEDLMKERKTVENGEQQLGVRSARLHLHLHRVEQHAVESRREQRLGQLSHKVLHQRCTHSHSTLLIVLHLFCWFAHALRVRVNTCTSSGNLEVGMESIQASSSLARFSDWLSGTNFKTEGNYWNDCR